MNNNLFTTERVQIASFVHALDWPYRGCKKNHKGRVEWQFTDTDGRGGLIELLYEKGAKVSASSLFASERFIKREMYQVVDSQERGRRNGKSYPTRN